MVVFLFAGAAAIISTTITRLILGRSKKTTINIDDFVKFDTATSEDDMSSLFIWSDQIRDHPTPNDYLDIVLNSIDTVDVSRYSGSLPQLPADIDDEDYW
jgi:hypothetical protein